MVEAKPAQHKIDAGGALGLAASIEFASFGSAGSGAMDVTTAFATAHVAAVDIAALSGYAGYRYIGDRGE